MIVEIRDEVVALSGALTRNQWRTLESAVKVRLKHHPGGIVVDCGGLQVLTPEGAKTFRDAAEQIARSDARIVVSNVPPEIMRVLRRVPNLCSHLPIAETVAEARASLGLKTQPPRNVGEGSGSVVVGLLGTEADPHAVAVACRLQQNPGAPVHLVYLLVVPRNLPLLSPLAREEEEAQRTLERLDAAVRAKRRLPVRRVERTRDPAARLLEVSGEISAIAIVLALPPEAPEALTEIANTVLARASCDVVVNRLPSPQAATEAVPVLAAGGGARGGARA